MLGSRGIIYNVLYPIPLSPIFTIFTLARGWVSEPRWNQQRTRYLFKIVPEPVKIPPILCRPQKIASTFFFFFNKYSTFCIFYEDRRSTLFTHSSLGETFQYWHITLLHQFITYKVQYLCITSVYHTQSTVFVYFISVSHTKYTICVFHQCHL